MKDVERVKAICKERHIPISKIEQDLGFSNGYIASLRKGFPADRLMLVADYLGVTMRYLITGQEKTAPALSAEAVKVAYAYDRADDRDRHVVGMILERYMTAEVAS